MSAGGPPLRSVVLHLEPCGALSLPPATGRLVHGAFFDILGERHPDLADALHPNGQGGVAEADAWRAAGSPTAPGTETVRWPPFTLSPLGVPAEPLHDGWTTLRITSLDGRLSDWLGGLEAGDLDAIRVGRIAPVEFRLRAIAKDPEQDPWAGASFWEELVASWGMQPGVSPLVRLDFETPTTFRKSSRSRRWNELFPTPQEVFTPLLEKWHAFAPADLRFPVDVDLDGVIMTSRYELESCYVTGGFPAKGFRGWCEYEINRAVDEITARAIHVLTGFAFFAGIGSMPTMGMGQAWPSHPQPRRPAARRFGRRRKRGTPTPPQPS